MSNNKAPIGTQLVRFVRGQLGSVRKVYLNSGEIERRDDFGSGEVVLLLHGFMQTRNIWEVMEDRLRFDGYKVMSFELGGLFGRLNTRPIDKIAWEISTKIERLAERHGFEKLHIIGHSKGGLIAKQYIQKYGGSQRVKSLITLGTPFHGASTAIVALPLSKFASVAELMPTSKIVRALNIDQFPEGIPVTSIYSKADMIAPWWSSVLRSSPGNHTMTNIAVKTVGHSALTWNAGIYRIVRKRLEEVRVR